MLLLELGLYHCPFFGEKVAAVLNYCSNYCSNYCTNYCTIVTYCSNYCTKYCTAYSCNN